MTKLILITFLLLIGSLTLAAQPSAQSQEKDWTMMVYLNGNNDLDEYGALNVNQMEKTGSDAHRNIVVQWASLRAHTTKRLLVQHDDDAKNVTSPTLEDMGRVDMGSKQTLLDFIEWSAKNFPAKKYFIVVWNHGGGWHFVGKKPRTRVGLTDISWDDQSNNVITTEQLGWVMHQAAKLFGHKVDLYASDACLMSMVEVAYQMQGAVETFAGSEETEPGEGWPYDSFLKMWNKNRNASSLEVGKMLANAYDDFYHHADEGQATFSVLNMANLPRFVSAMKKLGAELQVFKEKQTLMKVAKKAIRFFEIDYVDVGSLMKGLKPIAHEAALKKAIANVEANIKKTVYWNRTNTATTGISVWWPTDKSTWKEHEARYRGLDFNTATDWHTFLERLF